MVHFSHDDNDRYTKQDNSINEEQDTRPINPPKKLLQRLGGGPEGVNPCELSSNKKKRTPARVVLLPVTSPA